MSDTISTENNNREGSGVSQQKQKNNMFQLISLVIVVISSLLGTSFTYINSIAGKKTIEQSVISRPLLATGEPAGTSVSAPEIVQQNPETVIVRPTLVPVSPTPIPTPQPTPSISSNAKLFKWLYSDGEGCKGRVELTQQTQEVIMVDYYDLDVSSANALKLRPFGEEWCNGQSAENSAYLKSYSGEQFATINGGASSLGPNGLGNPGKRALAVETLVSQVVADNWTGVSIDIEEFSAWSTAQVEAYKAFLTELGNSLKGQGKKLLVYFPAITGAQNAAAYRNFKYLDYVSLPIDYFHIAAYDYYYDEGFAAGGSPYSFLESTGNYVKSVFGGQLGKVVIGFQSIGYIQGQSGFRSFDYMSALPGFATASRNKQNDEIMWQENGAWHNISDETTVVNKYNFLSKMGFSNIAVYSMGGNKMPR
jgi:Glycosyl hydrolases family 18